MGAITISKYKTIWNQIINILTTAQALPDTAPFSLGYVKDIRYGSKKISDIPELPAIIITPAVDREDEWTIPQNKKITWTISIQCWLKVIEKDNTVTGEILLSDGVTTKGITDFEADVKNILNNYPDLNGNAMKIKFPSSSQVFEVWPNQVVDIELEVNFLTLYNAR